ncbi:hypothetical protein [Mesorhizobium kowhaii]|uniref:Uncharacterized protein n=1 Tax=Mesorhizobium kowhaii TaxID=1300272 RepID=A0A2W7BUJ0_9HYPH|nr:hypothetical protein B5V02_31005 [Mesorhizobium kowhaii]
MDKLIKAAALTGAMSPETLASAQTGNIKPTIVLVHGAFAESAGCNGVLTRDGYPVAANPLRSVGSYAVYGASVVHGAEVCEADQGRQGYYPGAPHGITAMHQDQINADLLAFISNHDRASSAIPWRSQ